MKNTLRIVFWTRRGLQTLALRTFAFFGLVSAIVQFYGAVYVPDKSLKHPLAVVLATIGTGFLYGLLRTWPRSKVSRTLEASAHDVTVNVVVGDILKHKGQVVVGFSDTFDTDTDGNKVINARSLQGQLLAQRFNNDPKELDRALASSLRGIAHETTEKRVDKHVGKLSRYPIGTVAVLGTTTDERIYALAYSRMGNNLVAKSSVHDIWCALGQLWSAVYIHGQQQPIAIPLVGTGLARVNYLDRESMLRMTLISFVARSRENLICNELTVYIHPTDQDKINMLELKAFLKTL